MKYGTTDLSRFELDGADTANIVQSLVNDRGKNRSERRKIMKSLGKYQNRDMYFNKQIQKETDTLREKYQKELDSRLDDAQEAVLDGLADNWKKSTALAALVLKRKYNWSNGRVGQFIEKANDLHVELIESGEWESVLELLDKECDILLEVADGGEAGNQMGIQS